MKALLGYRSQRACVRALLGQGCDPQEIELKTSLDREQVRVLIKDIQRLDKPPAGESETPHLAISIDRRALEALGPAAARRQISEGALVRAVVGVLAREPELIDAVLDDGAAA